MRNLVNFSGALKKLKICTLRDFLLSNLYNVELNNYRGVTSWHWTVMQYLKKNWLVVWKMTRNFVIFHGNSRKSENLHFYGLLLSIAYKISAKKVQKCFLSWQWWVIQSLKKNELFVWKMTRGICLILTAPVSGQSENVDYDRLLLSKVCDVWAKQI